MAFAEYVLQQDQQLTTDDLTDKPTDEVFTQFDQQSEADKVRLLTALTMKSTAQFLQTTFIQRYIHYLTRISPDGQYAVIQQFAQLTHQHPELLKQLYEQATSDQTTREFYELIQKIATV